MSFFSSLDIAGSGLTANRVRLDTISENIANATTTRTENGGPYRRKTVVYEAVKGDTFKKQLNSRIASKSKTAGVRVTGIVEDDSDFQLKYDPTNPDANEQGYVEMPNVDTTQEIIDMMSASHSYQLNLNALDAMKQMATKALEIGK